MKFLAAIIIIFLILKISALLIPVALIDRSVTGSSFSVTDRNGQVLRELNTRDGFASSWINLDRVPGTYKNMLILSEDKRFYWHPGIDPLALGRALYQDVAARSLVSGGSTITQQLARMILSDKYERSYTRKVQEIFLALLLELKYSKNQILEAYINRVYLGYQNRGIKAASTFYFGKTPEALSLAEQAYLITLAKSPGGYNPFVFPERMVQRARGILDLSYQAKIITRAEHALALHTEPGLQKNKPAFNAPHFINYLLAQKNLPRQPQLYTTLDLALQNETLHIIQTELAKLNQFNVNNAACLVANVHTGEVLAYVGSQDFFDKKTQGQVDGLQALRQPGSALKPLIYAYALEHGFTPASVLPDLPATYYSNGGYFSPKNYSEKFLGPVSLRTALANSLNAPALYVMSKLASASDVLNTLRKLGLKSLNRTADHYGIGLILGNGEVSPWEMAQAYLTLANNGKPQPLRCYLKTSDTPREKTNSFAPATAYLISSILSDPLARQLSFGKGSVLEQRFPCAVKTGTSTNYRDNWCIGYTPDYLVVVWVGNFDGSPMHSVSGVTGAGPIWHRVMSTVVADRRTPFKEPPGIVTRKICNKTGFMAEDHCENTALEYFSRPMLQGLTACSPLRHNPAVAKEVSYLPMQPEQLDKQKIMITYPRDNSTFAIDPRINPSRQTIKLDFMAYLVPDKFQWFIDGHPCPKDSWQLTPGHHTVKIIAEMEKVTYEAEAKINVY